MRKWKIVVMVMAGFVLLVSGTGFAAEEAGKEVSMGMGLIGLGAGLASQSPEELVSRCVLIFQLDLHELIEIY